MRDYPPVPRVPDLAQPPKVCVAWIIAAEHEEMIDDILFGFGRWFWPATGELTTGPSEPVTKPETPPCLCRYGVRKVAGAPGPYFPLDPFGQYTRDWGVYAFRIHPKCLHHGDARYIFNEEAT